MLDKPWLIIFVMYATQKYYVSRIDKPHHEHLLEFDQGWGASTLLGVLCDFLPACWIWSPTHYYHLCLYSDMEKLSSRLSVLAENLEFHLFWNLKMWICWGKTFHYFHVCLYYWKNSLSLKIRQFSPKITKAINFQYNLAEQIKI